MPTTYTILRAQHRHKIEVPRPSLPKSQIFAAPANMTLLEGEHVLTSSAPSTHVKKSKKPKPKREVVIIGGGLAGLCAAYELQGLKYKVTVYEARDRVGGRVESITGFADKKTVEGGGELIGSNHALWNAYRHLFGLHFTHVREYGNSPIRLSGKTLSFDASKDLTDEMEKQFKLLTNLAESIIDPFEPWANRNAGKLDGISLGDWISRAKCSDLCKHAIKVMLAADNGVSVQEQSLLGVLAMIKGGGLDRYWTDTEVFRCAGGNQRLAECFQERLNKRKVTVLLDSPVQSIDACNNRISLRIKGSKEPVLADDVILAVPPSVWPMIDFGAFPEINALLSRPPALGTNVKCLFRFRARFWEDFASSPSLSEDGPVDLTWETTEQDKTGDFVMVAFSGAADAERCSAWNDDQRKTRYIEALERPYPGIAEHIEQLEFMNWPNREWTRASYYFPRVNEVTKWGPLWKAGYGGWLHFAGEHTCYAFVGYMEGALNSGYRLARRIAVRDGILAS